MSVPSTHRARLVEKTRLTPHVLDFIFELEGDAPFSYLPGQFVLVKCVHPVTGELLSRAYSIARAPISGDRRVTLNVEIVEGGKLTPLMNDWPVGHVVDMQGPFGHFTIKSGAEKSTLVFVGTGVGIAPLRAMIEAELSKPSGPRLVLYFGVRSQEDIFYQEVFESLAARHERFEFFLTLSQPKIGWSGLTGRVTAHLSAVELDPLTTDVYLCGGKPMIDDVREIFLQKGWDKKSLYFEPFFL